MVFAGQTQRCADLGGFQSFALGNRKIGEPDLERARVFVDVDVRRFVALHGIEIKPVAKDAQDGGHGMKKPRAGFPMRVVGASIRVKARCFAGARCYQV